MKCLLLCLLISAFGIQSSPGADDIVATAQKFGQFRILVEALHAAGLTQTLKGSGPFTLFAPNDDAFAKLPKGTLDDLLKPANKAQLAGILEAHILKGKLMAADARTVILTTVGNSRIQVTKDGPSLMYSDANVVKPDILASNGIVHVIDKVVIPDEEGSRAQKK